MKATTETDWFKWNGPGNFHLLNEWLVEHGATATDFFSVNPVSFGLLLGHGFFAEDIPAGRVIVRASAGVYLHFPEDVFKEKYNI